LRWTFLFAGFVQAVGMLVDAFQLTRGATVPSDSMWMWARVVEGVGLDPTRFGPVFLILAIAWIGVTIAVLRGHPGAHKPAAIVAAASLWYLVMGTCLSVIYLFALSTMRGSEEQGGPEGEE
jgi:hypothetical protein